MKRGSSLSLPRQALRPEITTPTGIWFWLPVSICLHFAVISVSGSPAGPLQPTSFPATLLSQGPGTKLSTSPTSEEPSAAPTSAKRVATPANESPDKLTFPASSEETQLPDEPIGYASPDEVDDLPTILPPPDFSLPIDFDLPSGSLILRLYIGIDGTADYVAIEASTLPNELSKTVVRYFSLVTYAPATIAGIPVKAWRRMEVGLGD